MLTFTCGCMRSGKTKTLAYSAENCQYFNQTYIVLIPETTVGRIRDYDHYHRLRIQYIEKLSDFKTDKKLNRIFIDDVNLFDPIDGISAIKAMLEKVKRVDAYGLRRDRFDKPYNELTQWLLTQSDALYVMDGAKCDIKGCYDVGYNCVLENDTGEKNVIDNGDTHYHIYCEKHWREFSEKAIH